MTGYSQDSIFPEVEGRIVYSKRIVSDSLNTVALWQNALDYLESLELMDKVKGQEIVIDNVDKVASAHQEFYLFKKGVITKQIEGVVKASVSIQIVSGGFEYSIDSILYQAYARNRYGKYAPKSSKKYSLESIYEIKSSKEWMRHFNSINGKIEEIMSNLEAKMIK